MDIIRDENITVFIIETNKPMIISNNSGTFYKENSTLYFTEKNIANKNIKYMPNFFQEIFDNYSNQIKQWILKAEIKLYIEQGYKIIKKNRSEIIIDVARFSINFSVWSLNGQKFSKGFGGTKEPDCLLNLESKLNELYKIAEEAYNIRKVKSGFYNVILNSKATGLFVHEVIGHCMEEDVIWKNSKLQEIFALNNKITSDDVTIIDNPTLPNSYGGYEFDDEGTAAQKVVLIEKGIVRNYMSANNGHLRAVSYKYPAIVRMSNTYMNAGSKKLEDLFCEIDNGIYLCGCGESKSGINFSISFTECYIIKKGKVNERIAGVKMFGNLQQTIKNIKGVSNDFILNGGGDGGCGKNDQWPLAVSSGGPHIRIDNVFLLI